MANTRLKRHLLRAIARVALRARGYRSISPIRGKGIALGALLEATKHGKRSKTAVRTSLNRNVQLDRLANGRWRTVSNVALVLVVVPSLEEFNCAQVLAFRPKILLRYVEQEVANEARNVGPVSIPIDGRRGAHSSLASLASWRQTLPLTRIDSLENPDLEIERLIKELKRAIAARDGIDEANVALRIQTSRDL